jgi:hypothetical protein
LLGNFIAGAYTGTYNSVNLGLTEDGWHLKWQFDHDMVDKTDGYGTTLIEMFIIGCQVWVGGTFKEWSDAGDDGDEPIRVVAPYNTWPPEGAGEFGLGIISRASSALAKALVLTSTTGTPAAANPITLTASKSIIDNNFTVEQVYGPRHRTTPFMLRLLPYLSSDMTPVPIFFTVT